METNNNNNNNNNIYRGSPTRQGGFQWGPHKLSRNELDKRVLKCTHVKRKEMQRAQD